MNMYEIQIGEIVDMTTNTKKPRQTLLITQEQFAIIELFAHQRKDADLNTVYTQNDCEFCVYPHFDSGEIK
jgi:hypothetical protein